MEKGKERKIINSRTLFALFAFVLLNALLYGYIERQDAKLTASIATNSINEKRREGDWIWWITRNYLVDGTNADVVFMGSSQMGSAVYASEALFLNEAVDTVLHRRSNLAESLLKQKAGVDTTAFNVSMGGAMASDQYMMARSLFTEEHKPKLVVLGVNPRDFIDNSMPSASSTDAFHYLSPYVRLGSLSNYAFADLIGLMDWQINTGLPTKTIGEQVKKGLPSAVTNWFPTDEARAVSEDGTVSDMQTGKVIGGEVKTAAAGDGDILKAIYGNQGKVKPDQWRVVACSWGAFKDNTQEYKVRYKDANPAIYTGQKKFFEQFLSYLKKENVKVLVVGMPSLWPNRALLPDKFWTDFRQYLSSTTTEYGAKFVDLTADDRFDSKDYLDTVHLNSTGGTRLLNIITSEIAADKNLASVLSDSSIAKKTNGTQL